VTQVGGSVNRVLSVANGETPWWMALGQTFGNLTTTEGWSRCSSSQSIATPGLWRWGNALFFDTRGLTIEGPNLFRTLDGSTDELRVRPLLSHSEASSASYQEQMSLSPFSVSASFSQMSSNSWQNQDRFATSLMQVSEGGRFTAGRLTAEGLDADVHNFHLSVLGDMHMSSPIDRVSLWSEQQSSGCSIDFLSLARGIATGDPLAIARSVSPSYSYDERTESHQWVSARSQFGGSGSSLTVRGHLSQVDADVDERVPVYSASRTVSTTPEIHESDHDYSVLGQAMRFAYALHGAYSMVTALRDNLQGTTGQELDGRLPEEFERKQEAAPEQKEEQLEPLSQEEQRVADAIKAEITAADRGLKRIEKRAARRQEPVGSTARSGVSASSGRDVYDGISARAEAGGIDPSVIERVQLLDNHARRLEALAAQQPLSERVQDFYQAAKSALADEIAAIRATPFAYGAAMASGAADLLIPGLETSRDMLAGRQGLGEGIKNLAIEGAMVYTGGKLVKGVGRMGRAVYGKVSTKLAERAATKAMRASRLAESTEIARRLASKPTLGRPARAMAGEAEVGLASSSVLGEQVKKRVSREARWLELANQPNSRLPKEVIHHINRHKGKGVSRVFGLELVHLPKKAAAQGHDYAQAIPKTIADHRGLQHRFLKEKQTGTTISKPLRNSKPNSLAVPKPGKLPK